MIQTLIEGRKPAGATNSWTAPVFPAMVEVLVFHMPKSWPHWYTPVGQIDLKVGQMVVVRSRDGSGEYAFARVLKIERTRYPGYLIGE